jgi:hypothetical protein
MSMLAAIGAAAVAVSLVIGCGAGIVWRRRAARLRDETPLQRYRREARNLRSAAGPARGALGGAAGFWATGDGTGSGDGGHGHSGCGGGCGGCGGGGS